MNALADWAIQRVDMPGEPADEPAYERVKMNEATVEERLARVETKTDRLIKDVDAGRAETRAQYEKLTDVIAANDKAVRTNMQEMEARLVLRQDEATTAVRSELKATEANLGTKFTAAVTEIRTEVKAAEVVLRKDLDAQRDSMRIDANRTFEAIGETRGYVKALVLVVAPLALAVTGYVLKMIFGGG